MRRLARLLILALTIALALTAFCQGSPAAPGTAAATAAAPQAPTPLSITGDDYVEKTVKTYLKALYTG